VKNSGEVNNMESKPSVLVVEDDSSLRRMMVIALEASGYEVRDAAHGEQAQEYLESALPDILITDLQMPIMDGITLVRWVRKEYPPSLSILVLTSLGAQEEAEMALKAGATKVAFKPLQLPKLLAEVSALLH
jgi:DNA-binding response OmpR family regulator